jgi:N,N'-diacetyllegionaminate synthase
MIEIIAEAGSNHNGELSLALELVDIAKNCGADSVKFQFIYPEGLYIPSYVSADSYTDNPVFNRRQKEVLSPNEWKSIWAHAKELNIIPSASVFDIRGLELLSELGAPYVKIASTDLNNSALIREVAMSGMPVYMSTGMSTISEIDVAVSAFQKVASLSMLTLFHCVSIYPCPTEESNLEMISVLKKTFGVRVGFSDHTSTNLASCIAVALGAEVIEKHFTVNKSLPGFDHAHALSRDELASFVSDIRTSALAIERKVTKVGQAESVTKIRARRGLYAARDLAEGEILSEKDVLVVRPKTELNPDDLHMLIGKKILVRINKYEPLTVGDSVQAAIPSWSEAADYWDKEMRHKKIST